MWKARLDGEQAIERARVERRAARETGRENWYAAWATYKARRYDMAAQQPRPRWWNVFGWVLWLLRLHAPGRPG
jgi:hypothetical protein